MMRLSDEQHLRNDSGTSKAILRFFSKLYCPKVMIARDRHLENRVEESCHHLGFTKAEIYDSRSRAGDRPKLPQGSTTQHDPGELRIPTGFSANSSDDPLLNFPEASAKSEPCGNCDNEIRGPVTKFEFNEDRLKVEAKTPCTVCSCVSSSSSLSTDDPEVICTTCEDCLSYLLKERSSLAGIPKFEDFCDLETDRGRSKCRKNVKFDLNDECSTVVDLTCEDKNILEITVKPVEDFREPRIMIADSSSRLYTSSMSGNGSLATALKDRSSCVIPIQPNRTLPIPPPPPAPIRRPQTFKTFRKLDVVELESPTGVTLRSKPSTLDDRRWKETEREKIGLESDLEAPDFAKVMQVAPMKRKSVVEPEEKLEMSKEPKKKRKCSEADSNQTKERVESILMEFSKSSSGSFDKCVMISHQDTWTETGFSESSMVSTTERNLEREAVNKVPPLRLKKIIREGAKNRCKNAQVESDGPNEPNYRIVTGATPRPPLMSETDSPIQTSWTHMSFEQNRTWKTPKSDGFKLKHRRSRLKEKLKDLHAKSLEVEREMSAVESLTPERSTKFRQLMNRYEKQIENVSKLLTKLSAGTSLLDAVEAEVNLLDVGSKSSEDKITEFASNDLDNMESFQSSSIPSSPEPPKLSPSSPTNYEEKLPSELRNSPPILPRVCLTMPPNLVNPKVNQDLESSVIDESWNHLKLDNKSHKDLENYSTGIKFNESTSISQENKEIKTLNTNSMSPTLEDSLSSYERKDHEESSIFTSVNKLIIDESPRTSSYESKRVHFPDNISDLANSSISEESDNMYSPRISTSIENQDSPVTNVLQLQSNLYDASNTTSSTINVNEQRKIEKVTSSSHQNLISECSVSTISYDQPKSVMDKVNEQASQISSHLSEGNRIMSEQFPTLGNWVQAKMSKKINSKQKFKVPLATTIPAVSTEEFNQFQQTPMNEMQKLSSTNSDIRNNVLNVAPRWNTEKRQRQNLQQRQQQRLLQRATTPTIPSQLNSSIAQPHSGICPPVSMTQFYPNDYPMDPYARAFAYHAAVCPYGYQCHNGLQCSTPSVGSYPFPIQETLTNLRPIQQIDKRSSSLHDPARQFTPDLIKYPGSLTTFQHSGNINVDRYGSVNGQNSLLLPQIPQTSTVQQSFSRSTLSGSYPATNSHFSRTRIIPDMVAAAAAAAVVAAASFEPRLNKNNLINSGTRSAVNQPAASLRNSESMFGGGYQMPNIIMDGLSGPNGYGQNFSVNSQASNVDQSVIPSSSYQFPSVANPQISNLEQTECRDTRTCETPHLGKVTLSPNNVTSLCCSNCGLPGSLFKCLGCETAFYCNETCQTRHWNIHVEICPKKMPRLKKVA
ncbi:uncharacterized protein [Prorops nasuta]|uniref:uncharacterized protein isoform X2 n=1 Tax=Prorops nasuta TaxID=863751 RepID=UPI0034CE3194